MSALIMFYDTETTGKGDFKADYAAPHQPHLVQVGFKVMDPVRRETIYEVGHLVDSTRLPTWKGIEPDAEAIHGVSELSLKLYGVSPEKSMAAFLFWAERCFMFIAHNESFDSRIMQCHAKRTGYHPDVFQGGQKYCTMLRSTQICQVPAPNGRGGFKWPTLTEAYKILVDDRGFGNAHNALADVNACAEIFWKHVERQMVAHIGTEGFARG